LLEILGATENHCFYAKNETSWEYLLAKTRVSEDTANEILNKLAKLDAIDRELWESEKAIWIENFVSGVAHVYSNRKRETPKKPISTNKNPNTEGVSISRNDSETEDSENNYEENASKRGREVGKKEREEEIARKRAALESRIELFKKEVFAQTLYPKSTLEDFFEYWTELNKSKTKFKQEMETTWSLSRRLKTWANNEGKFGNNREPEPTGTRYKVAE
jgi:hypothetical protein